MDEKQKLMQMLSGNNRHFLKLKELQSELSGLTKDEMSSKNGLAAAMSIVINTNIDRNSDIRQILIEKGIDITIANSFRNMLKSKGLIDIKYKVTCMVSSAYDPYTIMPSHSSALKVPSKPCVFCKAMHDVSDYDISKIDVLVDF